MNRSTLLIACTLCLSLSAAVAQVDRSKLPDGKASVVWTPPKVNVFSLANGVSVWHVEQRHTPLVTSMLVMPRGAALEPAESAGGIALMVDLMDEGAGDRDALEISAEMQRLAMDFGATVNSDATTLSMNILAEKLDESFAVFADILMKPKFQASDFERRKAQRIASSIASEADLGRSAFRVTARRLFLDGYSGMPINGTKTTLESVTLDRVRAAYPQVITPVGSTLVVVGAVSSEQLKKTLEQS
ncbi:MAG: M16 family metallopeptidase, partial [Bradymonadia bacterium]